MKEKLTRNIGLKILSIILAALLWLVITNLENPISKKPFYNVPVQILNEAEIKKLNKIYDIKSGETINFTVSARRKITEELTAADFKVTADFSKLSELNTVSINITCPRYGNEVTVVNGNNEVMKITLEDVVEKPFKVNVVQKGEPADGYYVYQKTANTLLRVSGPKSKIDSIAQIVVEVNVSEERESFHIKERPKALDVNGNEIDSSHLQFSESGVLVAIDMYKTKTINLNVLTKGKPADGYMISKIEYEPKTIVIAAPDDLLQTINDLTVEEDVTGASTAIEKEINLQDQLPKGVILVGENQSAVINVTVDQAETKEITFLPEDIDIKNKPLGYNLDYLTMSPITVQVNGPFKRLKISNLTKDIVKPYIDLTNYTGGTYAVKLGADLPEYLVLENDPAVNIRLMK